MLSKIILMAKAKQNLNLKIQMLAGNGTKAIFEIFYKKSHIFSYLKSCPSILITLYSVLTTTSHITYHSDKPIIFCEYVVSSSWANSKYYNDLRFPWLLVNISCFVVNGDNFFVLYFCYFLKSEWEKVVQSNCEYLSI